MNVPPGNNNKGGAKPGAPANGKINFGRPEINQQQQLTNGHANAKGAASMTRASNHQ